MAWPSVCRAALTYAVALQARPGSDPDDMSAKKLVVVESPAKAKTLSRYLGRDFVVKASVGHVVDLPKNKLGVDLEKDFAPHYEIIHGKGKVIAELRSALKGKEIIYLGPDPDR